MAIGWAAVCSPVGAGNRRELIHDRSDGLERGAPGANDD